MVAVVPWYVGHGHRLRRRHHLSCSLEVKRMSFYVIQYDGEELTVVLRELDYFGRCHHTQNSGQMQCKEQISNGLWLGTVNGTNLVRTAYCESHGGIARCEVIMVAWLDDHAGVPARENATYEPPDWLETIP
jgi:hypothetical protein